jgi:hypothetical protein
MQPQMPTSLANRNGPRGTRCRRSSRLRRAALWLVSTAALLLSVVLTPLDASAQTEGVITTVGAEGILLDPTLIRVPVEISCAPMEVSYDMGGHAQLEQAVSKRLIAHGQGWEENAIVCDGTAHPNTYLIWADTTSPPFEKGDATAWINAYLCGPTGCQSGGSGTQITQLTRR